MDIKQQTIRLYHTLETAIAERDALTNDEILQDLTALGYRYSNARISEAKLKWTDIHTDLLQKLTPAYTMFKSSSSRVERKSRSVPEPSRDFETTDPEPSNLFGQVNLDSSSPEEIADVVLNSVTSSLNLPDSMREAMEAPVRTYMRQMYEIGNASSSSSSTDDILASALASMRPSSS